MSLDCLTCFGNHLRVPFDVGVTHAADLMPRKYLRNRLGSAAFNRSRVRPVPESMKSRDYADRIRNVAGMVEAGRTSRIQAV